MKAKSSENVQSEVFLESEAVMASTASKSVTRIKAKSKGCPEKLTLFISTSRFITVAACAIREEINFTSSIEASIDAALEIAVRRGECIARLRQAVEANNVREIVHIAKELCGCEQTRNRAD